MTPLEVCAADPDSLAAAVAGGADRVEICSALEIGGLTPSPGLMALAARAPVPAYALIRPRAGDFAFGPADEEAMLADIAAARRVGLAGVVLGASHPDGTLDESRLDRLSAAAGPLGRTLHRAIDAAPDLARATDAACDMGFERVLSAGGARTAPQGTNGLRAILRAARGRLRVMAGGGLTPANVRALIAAAPVHEVHGSCAAAGPPQEAGAVRLGFAEPVRRRTDAAVVRAMRAALAP